MWGYGSVYSHSWAPEVTFPEIHSLPPWMGRHPKVGRVRKGEPCVGWGHRPSPPSLPPFKLIPPLREGSQAGGFPMSHAGRNKWEDCVTSLADPAPPVESTVPTGPLCLNPLDRTRLSDIGSDRGARNKKEPEMRPHWKSFFKMHLGFSKYWCEGRRRPREQRVTDPGERKPRCQTRSPRIWTQ